ncbi:hypothetical protein B0H14DRAFT_3671224 [Mycena olivaceomarginata]|nr:hypothetical protein B0H14DRAFT_3671224 [Mycena olivaceomarginata]
MNMFRNKHNKQDPNTYLTRSGFKGAPQPRPIQTATPARVRARCPHVAPHPGGMLPALHSPAPAPAPAPTPQQPLPNAPPSPSSLGPPSPTPSTFPASAPFPFPDGNPIPISLKPASPSPSNDAGGGGGWEWEWVRAKPYGAGAPEDERSVRRRPRSRWCLLLVREPDLSCAAGTASAPPASHPPSRGHKRGRVLRGA